MRTKKNETFSSGALKLTIAGLVVRLMGFANRIFMSNLIGSEGMGLYQLTFPVYSLIILTLTSGVSVTVSGLTAKYKASGRLKECKRSALAGFVVLLVSGTVCGALMAAFARPLATYVLGDSRTALSIALLSPCIPIVASASALKGYFYGMSRVTPTAISQITEQVVRIAFIFIFAGVIAGKDLENACAIITLSSAVGEMANLLVVAVAFALEKRSENNIENYRKLPETSFGKEAAGIVKSSLPVSAGRFVTSMIGTVEAIILPGRFLKGGLNYTASLSMLGKLSGMAMPLITFPTVVTSAMATTLVPAISSALSTGNIKLARERISKSITLSFTMGFLFFGVFSVFGVPLGALLFPGEKVGVLLQEMSVFCLLLYLQQTLTGILNGLDKQTQSLVSTLAGSAVRLGFLWVAVPIWGVDGYIAGMLAGSALSCGISLLCVVKCTKMPFEPIKWVIFPAIPALSAAALGEIAVKSFPFIGENIVLMGLCLCLCGILWFFIMFLTGQLNFYGKYGRMKNNCDGLCRRK